MGRRGPPPKPEALKRLQGTSRPDRAASNAYRPNPGVPALPKGLGNAGRTEWRRIVAELGPAGVISRVHASLMRDLCLLADDAERFRDGWQADGMTVESKGRPFAHPLIAAEADARRQMNILRRELGLTPAAASRISTPAPPQKDEAEDFLFSGGLQVVK